MQSANLFFPDVVEKKDLDKYAENQSFNTHGEYSSLLKNGNYYASTYFIKKLNHRIVKHELNEFQFIEKFRFSHQSFK